MHRVFSGRQLNVPTILLLALLVGAALRAIPFFSSDFPLGDGGLFWAMARDISQSDFALPATVFYPTHNETFPFCYPPLSFFIAALWGEFFSLQSAFMVLPFLASWASIYCFWRFCDALTEEKFLRDGAALLWAVCFASMEWHLAGGGWPRALGLCFVLLALERALRFWRSSDVDDGRKSEKLAQQRKEIFWTAFWLGLAILTHLERARFGAWSLGLLWLFFAGKRENLLALLVMWGGAFLLALPWLGVCVARFGVEPFRAAAQTAGQWEWHWGLVTVPLLGLPSLRVGLAFVAVWLTLTVWIEIRGGHIFPWLPLSLSLAALSQVVVPSRWPASVQTRARWGIVGALTSALAVHSALELRNIDFLSRSMRQSFEWVENQTPKNARFLVTPVHGWARDLPAEWFPGLTGRASVATVQGSEWLKDRAFDQRRVQQENLIFSNSWPELLNAAQQTKWRFDWILIAKAGTPAAPILQTRINAWLKGARSDPNWKVVFENDAALILKRANEPKNRP